MNMPVKIQRSTYYSDDYIVGYNEALGDVQALNKGTVCVSEENLRKYLSKARVLRGIKEVPENYINEIITYLTIKGE